MNRLRTPYQFIIKRCRGCRWLFNCPTGTQESRTLCSACESKA
jgi:hypothetical protein